MDINDFVSEYPVLYHMAECDSWANVYENGLLSTSALLDLYEVTGDLRLDIESRHRPESIEITRDGLPPAMVRDQKPMSDSALGKVLLDGLAPRDWYETLNAKVFFWSSEDKVQVLLNARAYRDKVHDVISVDTAKLVQHYGDRIVLCPYNSGSTIWKPVKRGRKFFASIEAFDFDVWRKKRGRSKAVTEVCVEGGVENIRNIVIEVKRMQRGEVKAQLYP
tara:strand:- start:8804 stop:9466 length:663 start_codon:yes stop_codon:yes gene_type:complete